MNKTIKQFTSEACKKYGARAEYNLYKQLWGNDPERVEFYKYLYKLELQHRG